MCSLFTKCGDRNLCNISFWSAYSQYNFGVFLRLQITPNMQPFFMEVCPRRMEHMDNQKWSNFQPSAANNTNLQRYV